MWNKFRGTRDDCLSKTLMRFIGDDFGNGKGGELFSSNENELNATLIQFRM